MEKLYDLAYEKGDIVVPICTVVAEQPEVVAELIAYYKSKGKRMVVDVYNVKRFEISNCSTEEEDTVYEAIAYDIYGGKSQGF